MPVVLQSPERAKKVPVEAVTEVGQRAGVPVVVEAREITHDLVARSLEAGDVRSSPRGTLGGEVHEVVDDQRVAKLFRQDRRDAKRDVEGRPFLDKIVEGDQQGEVGLGDRLVHPLFAMRPHSRLPGIWQMAVQNEGESADIPHGHSPDTCAHPARRIDGNVAVHCVISRRLLQRMGRPRCAVVVRIGLFGLGLQFRAPVQMGELAKPSRKPFVQIVLAKAP